MKMKKPSSCGRKDTFKAKTTLERLPAVSDVVALEGLRLSRKE